MQGKGQTKDPFAQGATDRRILGEEENQVDHLDLSKYLTFSIERGAEDSAPIDELQFTVKVADIKDDDLSFQIVFDDPAKVSIGSSKDIMTAKSSDQAFFSSLSTGFAIPVGTKKEIILPKMLSADTQ